MLHLDFQNLKLRLKVGVSVLLINIAETLGLCNATRLIITKIGRYVLEGKVIFDNNLFPGYHDPL
jgi:hypothetical protein